MPVKKEEQDQELEIVAEAQNGTWRIELETPSCKRLYIFTRYDRICYGRRNKEEVDSSKLSALEKHLIKGHKGSGYLVYTLRDDQKRGWGFILVRRDNNKELYFVHRKLLR